MLEIGGILLMLGLVAFAAARIGISAVPFFLLAGLVVGVSYSERLQALTITYVMLTAVIGSVLLLVFRSGFERSKP